MRGHALINAGDLSGADAIFNAILKSNPNDIGALQGAAMLAGARNEFQKSLEFRCKAIVAGGQSPLAELAVEDAFNVAAFSKDPAPFLNLLNDTQKLSPHTRDILRECVGDWHIQRGNYSEAINVTATIKFIDKWTLIGPFDNRDKAGFTQVQDPEKDINFEKSCEGRNRRVTWSALDTHAYDGRVIPSEIFEPHIHVSAYAVTLVKSEREQSAVLRAGCAGALAVWVNGVAAGRVDEYNDFGRDKVTAPVALRKGWNLILVKSAVVEETQWAFSVRLCDLKGGALAGITYDNSSKALAEWKDDKSPAPKVDDAQFTTADLGIVRALSVLVKNHPGDAFALALLGGVMDMRKLSEKNNSSGDSISPEKLLRKAISLSPKNPMFKIDLASISDDNNEARLAAEAAYAAQPDLPCALESLAYLAHESHTHIAAEDYARKAWNLYGVERSGMSALVLADEISGIDRSFSGVQSSGGSSGKSERAEAWRILSAFTQAHPYLAEGWIRRAELEDSRTLRRETIEKAMQFCGGNARIRQIRVEDLIRLGKDTDAATLSSASLTALPFDANQTLIAANEFRRAGDAKRSGQLFAVARNWAPENPDVLSALAEHQLREGKTAEAADLFKKALTVKPNAPQVKDYLALLDTGGSVDRQFFAPYDIALKDLALPKAGQFSKDNIVKILNQEVIRVNPNGSTSRMIHIVGKVLRPAGVRDLNQHYIYYEPGRQTVDILRAAVITPDGRELARAVINDRSTSAAMGVQTLIYDEHHLKHVTFNNLEPGSIIDFQYTIRDSGDNIYGDYFSDSFYFNDGHPSMRSEYVLDYPKTLAVQTHTLNTKTPLQRLQSKDANREVLKWETKELPGVEHEFAMPPVVDSLPQVQVSTMASWQEVGTWFWNLAKEQVVVNDEMRNDIKEMTKDCKTQTEKLQVIHDWVIRKIRYLGIEFGRNGYKPHKATESYKALYGDCKDTATLITAMLKVVDIDCKLVLIRTVDSGALAPDTLPMPNLYNHCIAYVPSVDGKDYWIDGTTDFFRLGEVPSSDRGALVMVAGPEGGKFMKIPQSKGTDNLIEQNYDVKVAKNGSATLTVRDTRSGQFAPMLRESIETPGKFKSGMKDLAARRFNGAELKKLGSSDPLNQGPAWSEMELAVPNLGSRSGDRLTFPSVFEPVNLTGRYATDARRTHDIELYVPWARKTVITYHFEPGLKIASLPEPQKIENSFGVYIRTLKQNGDTLIIDEFFEMPTTRIPVKDYEAFKAFCHKVDALMEQKVLLQTN
ncbi:MAG: DUF3857 domain-containing protein [Planctomycetota bacterium]